MRSSEQPTNVGMRLCAWLQWLVLGCLMWSGQVIAQGLSDPALQRGVTWLQGQIQASGPLASEISSPALPIQVRSEAATTLRTLGQTVPPALYTAIDGVTPDTTEYLARKALAKQQAAASDGAYLEALLKFQNADGGFGAISGQASNPQDTAWALRALAATQSNSVAAVKALGWLTSAQQSDGQWKMVFDGDAVVTTSLAVQALAAYRQQPAAQAALVKARAWLTAQRNANQLWSDDLRTAHALLAVLPGLDSAASMQGAVDGLRRAQLPNGSWASEGHLTALALRALWLAGQPTTNPDLVSLSGQVVNEAGQPIAGATIRLTNAGQQTTTDADGKFGFTRLSAGQEQLDIQASGFRPMVTQLSLQPGQQLDLGIIRMSVAGSGSTGVTVKGTARQFNGTAYSAASGATIQVGAQSVRTDGSGNYQIDGLPAGNLELSGSYSNYPVVRASINAVAGQVIEFSPVFQRPRPTSTTLVVTVTDEAGQPLPSTSVMLQTTTRTTDAQGQATFTTGVLAGANKLTVTRSGYERLLVDFQAMDGQRIELPVTLRKVTSNITTLKGVVTNADTQQPLASVTVRLEGTAFETQTNAAGEYQLVNNSISGTRTVVFEKANYLTHKQTFAINGGATTVFNVPLRPEPVAAGPGRLEVSVQARGSGTPLSAATITLSGANQRSVQTDASGNAVLDNLNPGETQIQVSAAGYEVAMATMSVKTGQRYVLPVELLATANAQHKFYGQVVDAVSQMPISGARVALTGAASGSVTTLANGAYGFDNVTLGTVQIEVTRAGYVTFRQTVTLAGTTEAKIPLTPSWQTGDTSAWEVFGSVVDADTLEPLVGAQLNLEEVIPGSAVTNTQAGATELGGRFVFSGLTEANARIFINLNGYDSTLLPFARQGTASQSLGTIKLKRSYNAALPDLTVGRGDRSGLVMDPNTFRATGHIGAVVTNNSNYATGGFDAIAFLDTNGNQAWEDGVDTLLARTRIGVLPQQQSQALSFELKDAKLPFRDAPIYVKVDSGLEVIENIEGNNTLRVGVSCAGGGGSVQDVGVCIDTSGSVAHLYNLEMEGVVKAVENPNIIPHDGSVRFMLGTDREMYYGNGIPLHQAQIITPAILPQLIQDLKTKRNSGGYSSGPTCVRRMSEYMLTLPQNSNSKTIITVGDGYWEGISKALTELPKTVANGVGRVDVIGIGSVNLPELEANAWPKPPNSLHGGQVTVAYSSGEVAAAMAQALGAAAQTVDLTLGNFRLLDQGTGRPVRLTARVGNAGSPSQVSIVRFYQGTRLLGEVDVPALKAGEWIDVDLPAASLTGSDSLVAIVNESRTNPECNIANNRQQIDLNAANALALLKVQTDKPIYGTNAAASLSAVATNQGSFAAAFDLVLTIVDSQGAEVATFGRQKLGTLASGANQSNAQPWNTSAVLAGNYILRGRLFDSAGNVVAEDQAPFAIVAGDPALAAVAALTVSTDKGDYTPNDVVLLGNVASNLAANAIIDAARVRLTVRDPQGAVVFTHEHAVGQMPPRALRELRAPQGLRNAALGTYTVEATLYGRGPGLKRLEGQKADPELELARASTSYRVLASGQTGAIAGLTGSVSIARDSVKAGEAQSRDDLVHNTSGVDFSSLKVVRVVAATEDGKEVQREEQTIALVSGGQRIWPQTPIGTSALKKGSYSVLLLAEVNGQLVALDQKAFTVTTDGQNLPPAGQITPVPTTSPGALAMLALALAWAAGAARRKQHRSVEPANECLPSTEEKNQ